jgi:hypothetical protein
MGIISTIINFFTGEGEKAGDICVAANSGIIQTCAFCGKPGLYRINEKIHFVYVCQADKDRLYPDIPVTGTET